MIFHRLLPIVALAFSCASLSLRAQPVHSGADAATRLSTRPAQPEDPTLAGTETLVFLRHGEKPPEGNGQLTPQGLNRALALATLLPKKFGRPDFLFAPDPAATIVSDKGGHFFYCRPLATIEPTAIALGLPVQTPFGFSQIDKLNAELTSPKYANALIFVAWEHGYEARAARNLMTQYHANPDEVPKWLGPDYDSLYVLKLTRTPGQPAKITFTLEHQGLDNLSKEMPTPAR